MAKALPPFTWENGFKQPGSGTPWVWEDPEIENDNNAYITPPSKEVVSSTAHNSLGINVIRTWPTLYDGTNNPHGLPTWWKPSDEVDVLIVGAGPSGLQVAISLARQGVSFRIIDKGDSPLACGRADGVQCRFMETIAQLGLGDEISEEGPLIERTAIYKDGQKLLFNRSHQSDSRYRGLHVITQGQIERIYVRDLARHGSIVERSTLMTEYAVDTTSSHPVRATIRNESSGKEERIRAKFLVGSDGAASMIRKQLNIPFDGVSTGIYWGIMDCIFESDYPHAWVFGSVISSKHGGCVIIPREDGYIRLYTQLDTSATGPLAASRQASDASFAEAGGRVDIHSITPDEVLAQANKIFAPYTLKFAAPMSWFAIWKISERVARSYSSPDMTTHLVGDAAHVHSVMGAFGLNASIMDSANLSWKLGLAAKGKAKREILMPTYGDERRDHAIRIIETSGKYLRFVCQSDLDVPNLHDLDNSTKAEVDTNETETSSRPEPTPEQQRNEDLRFLGNFFSENGQFLLGVDCPYRESILNPPTPPSTPSSSSSPTTHPPIQVKNGVRAPNPRICLSTSSTGYLYDTLAGPPRFHLILFLSTLTGHDVLQQAQLFASNLDHLYTRFGGADMFNLVVVLKCLPFELPRLKRTTPGLEALWREGKVVFDDRAPNEDAHTTWGANHSKGALVVVRPDLWVGVSAFPRDVGVVEEYFGRFLVEKTEKVGVNGKMNGNGVKYEVNGDGKGDLASWEKDGKLANGGDAVHANTNGNGIKVNGH